MNLVFLQRNRSRSRTHESCNAGRVSDHVPRIIGHNHLDQHIAGKDFFLDQFLLAVLDFLFLFHGDHDPENLVFHRHGSDPAFEIGFDFVLIPGIGMDNKPVFFHTQRLLPTKNAPGRRQVIRAGGTRLANKMV